MTNNTLAEYAPELLAALKVWFKPYEYLSHDELYRRYMAGEFSQPLADRIAKTMTLIAKAEGRT